MDATKQDLIDLIRRGPRSPRASGPPRRSLSRDLAADPHLRAAEHEVEDALLCIAEAIQMLERAPDAVDRGRIPRGRRRAAE